ncbi:MAG: PEP-CTERM sorting domain-containing protein [Marinobacter sp.]|uniref:PEP-CTERM sorting domain-containing protein n=1 Tax=Marinobacter sp. TaxID=50741 RepID=UPI00349FD7C7
MNAFSKALVLVALSTVASGVSANLIGGVFVGGVDLLIAQADKDDVSSLCGPGGSPTTELCWINTVLEPDTTYGVKTENQTYQFVDGDSSLIGYMLDSPTEYFMIKNATWWALFQNNADFDWAVIDTALLNSSFNLPDGQELTISHVATLGNKVVSVPEPGTLALLSLGLFAMGIKRRLRIK